MFHWSGADPHRWVWPVACPAVVAQAGSPELAVDWVVRFRAPPADHPLGVLMSRAGTAGNPVALIDYQDSGRLVAVAVAFLIPLAFLLMLCRAWPLRNQA